MLIQSLGFIQSTLNIRDFDFSFALKVLQGLLSKSGGYDLVRDYLVQVHNTIEIGHHACLGLLLPLSRFHEHVAE